MNNRENLQTDAIVILTLTGTDSDTDRTKLKGGQIIFFYVLLLVLDSLTQITSYN